MSSEGVEEAEPRGEPAAPRPRVSERTLRRLELGGWLGMTMLLAAFAAVSFDVVARASLVYVGVNVTGALLVAIICAVKRAWPAFALEVAWIVLTLPALWSGA